MYSLTKNLFRLSVFVIDLEQTPFFLKSDLSINNFAVLLHLRYLAKYSENIYFRCVPYFIKRQKFFLLSLIELFTISIQLRHSTLIDWLIFEGEQL